jgi:hypothetical protein
MLAESAVLEARHASLNCYSVRSCFQCISNRLDVRRDNLPVISPQFRISVFIFIPNRNNLSEIIPLKNISPVRRSRSDREGRSEERLKTNPRKDSKPLRGKTQNRSAERLKSVQKRSEERLKTAQRKDSKLLRIKTLGSLKRERQGRQYFDKPLANFLFQFS